MEAVLKAEQGPCEPSKDCISEILEPVRASKSQRKPHRGQVRAKESHREPDRARGQASNPEREPG